MAAAPDVAREPATASPGRVVLINALAQVLGGGITVTQCLTRAMALQRPQERFLLLHSHPQVARFDFPPNVQLLGQPALRSRARRWLWEQAVLPREARRLGADVILHLGGFAIFLSGVPQVAVWQNPNVLAPTKIRRPPGERFYAFVQRQIYALSLRKVACSVFLTANSLEEARRHRPLERYRCEVIHSGIDAGRIVVDHPPDLAGRERLVVSVGHAYFHKNYEAMIDAMAEYKSRYAEPVRLEILGGPYEGAYFERLEDRIRERGLEDRVEMRGAASPAEVRATLARSQVYLVTSLLETFGLTMFEAMGAGVPVIASDATCHPEVCGDAVLYCDPRDPVDIAAKVHQLLADPALQRELQTKGLARIRHFSWERAAERYLSTLDSVRGTRRG